MAKFTAVRSIQSAQFIPADKATGKKARSKPSSVKPGEDFDPADHGIDAEELEGMIARGDIVEARERQKHEKRDTSGGVAGRDLPLDYHSMSAGDVEKLAAERGVDLSKHKKIPDIIKALETLDKEAK